MPYWEYKVITSGKGGFATPALLEKFLNDLGRDEWEIIHYQSPPDNPLAFTGLARRSTQRDWTLEDAAAAAAKAEAEKLRAEFEAKFKAASALTPEALEESTPSFLEEKAAPDDGLRKLVDTSHDNEPEALEDERADEWDKLTAAEEEELPTFFEAIRPHMRRNQRGPGMSVGVDYLAKKWDLSEDDLKGALGECGFAVPSDEDAPVEYLEYDGDLYWINVNRRGELWINTKEKPRPVFRPVKATRIEAETPKSEAAGAAAEGAPATEGSPAAEATTSTPEGVAPATEGTKPAASALPEGVALLEKIRPHMRRNRRGPGGSGSMSFLSRALRTKEAELKAAFAALGLTLPAAPSDKPVYTEIGNELWWLNLDSRGGLWINGREKKEGETAAAAAPPEAPAAPTTEAATPPTEAAPSEAATAGMAPAVETASASSPPAGAEAGLAPPPPAEAVATTVPEPPVVADAAAVPSVYDAVTQPPMGFPSRISEPPLPAGGVPAAIFTSPVSTETSPAGRPTTSHPTLAAVRLLLKETRTGAIAGRIDRLAENLGKPTDELVAALVAAGLKVPEKSREKPVFVEHAGEILWFNKNAKGELWLNAKASKFTAVDESDLDEEEGTSEEIESGTEDGEKKPARRGGRPRAKKGE